MLDKAGDKEGFEQEALKIKNAQAKYNAFCKETGRTKRLDRTQVYEYNRSVSNKATAAAKRAKESLSRTNERVLVDIVGFKNVDQSFKKIDKRLANDATNQLKKLDSKFGVIKNSESTITSIASGKAEAYVSSSITRPEVQTLSLCPKYYENYSSHIKTIKSQIASNWSMPIDEKNLSVYDVTHEYGHMLQNVLLQQKMQEYGEDKLKASINSYGTTVKEKYREYFKIRNDFAKECYSEIVAIAKETDNTFNLSENISRYGKSDYQEFFAEVFANSQLGKPNALGHAMNKWLERKGITK